MPPRFSSAAMLMVLGCASGTPETAATPDASADCGNRYAVTVRNEAAAGRVFAYYSDASMLTPAVMLGDVGPRDERTFFFRLDEAPAAWVGVDGARVFPNDRTAQQRFRVWVTLHCDRG